MSDEHQNDVEEHAAPPVESEAKVDEAGADEAGADEAGADEAGADEAGADEAGADEAGADEAEADEAEAASEDADEAEAASEDADEAAVAGETKADEAEADGEDADMNAPTPEDRSVQEAHLKSILESLIFVSDKPVGARRLAKIAKTKPKEVDRLVAELIDEYAHRGLQLLAVAGGYQFRSAAANAPFVREIVAKKPIRLSRAQLETLAISAYRQPLTRPELEEIRGVDSASALKVLLERGLLKILGRKEEPGRPLLYGTTPAFLEFFGLKNLDGLPTLKEFSDLTDESRALFARKTGEAIESIADIEVPEPLDDDDLDDDDLDDDDLNDDDLNDDDLNDDDLNDDDLDDDDLDDDDLDDDDLDDDDLDDDDLDDD